MLPWLRTGGNDGNALLSTAGGSAPLSPTACVCKRLHGRTSAPCGTAFNASGAWPRMRRSEFTRSTASGFNCTVPTLVQFSSIHTRSAAVGGRNPVARRTTGGACASAPRANSTSNPAHTAARRPPWNTVKDFISLRNVGPGDLRASVGVRRAPVKSFVTQKVRGFSARGLERAREVGPCFGARLGAEHQTGERTRPACRFGRPAQTFVPKSAFPAAGKSWWNEVFGGPPKTARQRRALPASRGFVRLRLRSSGYEEAEGGVPFWRASQTMAFVRRHHGTGYDFRSMK